MSKKTLPLIVLGLGMLSPFAMGLVQGQSAASATSAAGGREALGGIWVLNREKSQLSGREVPQGDSLRSPRGGDGGFGRRGGGRGAFGGGGRGGFGGGRAEGRGNPEQMEAMLNYLRTLNQPSDRLTIVVHAGSVGMTDADGRTQTLQTDNKKTEERAENGLVKLKRRSHWDEQTLVSEIEVDNGPKIERTHELSPGGTELRIRTSLTGQLGRGGKEPRLFVYERELDAVLGP